MDDKLVKNYISYVSGMIDMVKSYKDILITLSNNMRQDMRSLYLDSEMNDSKIRDVGFPQPKKRIGVDDLLDK